EIRSETGGTVDVQPQLVDANWEATQDASVEPVESGVYRVKVAKGGSVLFWPNDQPKPNPEIRIDDTEQPSYSFGLSAKRE
ncbi:MAG: hypothetical protein ACF8CQ_05445, partial [Rhodopirellula sp. JB044]